MLVSICASPRRLPVAKRFGTDISEAATTRARSVNGDALPPKEGQKMLLQQIASRIAAWLNTGREIENLRHIEERLLTDMGIKRDDISRRVRGR
jgi:uncharacterized protein YjiS (DUF1127 family)